MSTNEVSNNKAAESTNVANAAMKLEVVVIPVSDVDRAKEFYAKLGWRVDVDRAAGNAFRLVQFTPPGSGSSIQFGVNLTSAAPGSAQGMLLAVTDIEAARQQLVAQGVDASSVFHCTDLLGIYSLTPSPQLPSGISMTTTWVPWYDILLFFLRVGLTKIWELDTDPIAIRGSAVLEGPV
jgi:predicted enzyme related to lactoylglutathione lyase